MILLKKNPKKDFKILNISDPQLKDKDWIRCNRTYDILINTVNTLVKRTNPDLITVSGDISWSDNYLAYEKFADLIDSFGIPWAIIWGNNDNHDGKARVEEFVNIVTSRKHCIYESGDPRLGNGNYVIGIEENGKIVEGIIMMDSHDRMPYDKGDGNTVNAWAKLTCEQVKWYKESVAELSGMGCNDTMLITHIPIHAYKKAMEAAHDTNYDYYDITVDDSYNGIGWNPEYKKSVGVMWDGEGVSCYPEDDGMFDAIKSLGSTKHVLAGHNHMNNFIINYDGICLAYTLKLGEGSYWDPHLNGGTLITVTSGGISDVHHEYVNDYIEKQ